MSLSHKRKVGNFRTLKDGTIKVTVTKGSRLDGRQRRVTAKAHDMADAERIALELAAELGKRPDLGHGLTLNRWWDAYASTKGKRLANATYEGYRSIMRRVWLPAFGPKDISLITSKDVQAVLIALPTKSAATHAKAALSAVLTQAVRDGYLSANPVRGVNFELPEDVGAVDSRGLDFGSDPFATIEETSDIWDVKTVLTAMERLRGVPLESCWLCMVGAGLRREEALALCWKDVRRTKIVEREVTQVAVYKALTARDGLKRTKTRRSVRVVTVIEPFGSRLWELRGNPDEPVCSVSVSNIHHRWHALFEPVTSKHAKTEGLNKGKLSDLKFVPLNRMRATHSTIMQEAGVLDSINAAVHGHSEKVAYSNYQRPDAVGAAAQASQFLLMEGGLRDAVNG